MVRERMPSGKHRVLAQVTSTYTWGTVAHVGRRRPSHRMHGLVRLGDRTMYAKWQGPIGQRG